MTVVLQPHRTLPDGAPAWSPWQVKIDDGDPVKVEGGLDDWDYASELTFYAGCRVEPQVVAECTGRSGPGIVRLVGMVDCRSTLRRFVATEPLDQSGAAEVAVPVPAGCVADSVTLSLHLVLGESSPPGPGHTPTRAGSRLAAAPSVPLALQRGSQFPTEAVSFSAVGFDDTPWKLHVDASDWDATFQGAVRLWINTDHEAGMVLLSPGHPLFTPLTTVVKATVIAQLIGVAGAGSIHETDSSSPDSLLAGLEQLADIWFKESLMGATCLLREDPTTFWARLAHRAELLKGVP